MRNVEFCSPSKAFACSILLLTAVCCGLAARPAKSQSEGMRYMDIVERLRSDDPAVRLTASRALIKAGGLATPELMRKLRDSLRQEPFEKRERTSSYTLELMNVLAETLERQPEVVSVFRNNDDCELAKALVKLATSNDKTTRGLATIILANSIDNTTLPLVTAEVQKKGLNNSSLLNLLGIIRIKADYAMVDNKILIETAVRSIRQEYGPSVARDVSDALQGVEMELRKSTKTISAKDRFGKDYCVVPQE